MTPSLEPRPMDLDRLLDTAALQQLVWTYCHAVDRGDLALLRTLYHDDAIDDHGSMFRGTPDEYVAWLPGMLSKWEMSRHVIDNMLFLIDGDRAEGELLVSAHHRTSDGTRELVSHGRYLDRYEKRGGIWRFSYCSIVLDSMEERPAPAERYARARAGGGMGSTGRDDACYRRLPLFAGQRAARD